MSIKTETFLGTPFANNAGASGRFDITDTNETDYPQKATFELGFPPETRMSTSAGGKNPFGQDFNGIFYLITSALRELQAGKTLTYNEDFANAIGGYTVGAKVTGRDGLIYICTTDGNTSDPTGLDGWQTFLNSATDSESETQAATSLAVKQAYDLAKNSMQLGTGGIGLDTQTATSNINIDTYAFKVGFYSGSNWSSTKGLPFGSTSKDVWFYLINQNLASDGDDYKLQILGLNQTGTPRLAMRYKVRGNWTDWTEFASKEDVKDLGNDFQVIYPNGSDSNPPTLTNNQRVVIENPFETSNCYAVTELYLKNQVSGNMEWFTYSNMNKDSATYGLLTNVSDTQIIVQTAANFLIGSPTFDGNPWSYSSQVKSAPFRVRVIKLGN